MIYNFVKYEGKGTRDTGCYIKIKNDWIFINKKAFSIMGKCPFIDLYYDIKKKVILIKPGKDRKISVNKSGGGTTRLSLNTLKKGNYDFIERYENGFLFKYRKSVKQ